MDNLKGTIDNYLKSDEEFSLLIDGGWGTGKTHFIEKHSFFSISDLEENTFRNVISISLNGKNSLEDIKRIIIGNILNKSQIPKSNGNTAITIAQYVKIPFIETAKLSGDLLNYIDETSIEKLKSDLNKHNENILIIIDDLERISDEISIKNFLGFVRTDLLDKLESKVIMIGNLDEMPNKDCFEKFKEKVIGKTLKFESNIDECLEMIDSNLEKYINIENNKDDLIQIIDKSNQLPYKTTKILKGKEQEEVNEYREYVNNPLNIRTLKLVISDFKTIISKIEHNLDKEQINDIHLSIFYSLFIINNELRNSNYNKDNIRSLQGKLDYNSVNEFVYGRYIIGNKNVESKVFISSEIINYILHGNMNFSKFTKEINDNFNPEEPELPILDKLNTFDFEDEAELTELLKTILELFKCTEDINKKLDIFLALTNLNNEGLYIADIEIENVEEELIDSYTLEKFKKLQMPLSGRIIFNHNKNNSKDKLKERLVQKESEITLPDFKNYIEAILDNDTNTIKEIESLSRQGDSVHIFSNICNYSGLLKEKFQNSTSSIKNLHSYLAVRYLHFNEKHNNANELDDLISLIKDIEKLVDDKVKLLMIKHLISMIESIK